MKVAHSTEIVVKALSKLKVGKLHLISHSSNDITPWALITIFRIDVEKQIRYIYNLRFHICTGSGTRTRTAIRPTDFKSVASTIPPSRPNQYELIYPIMRSLRK